MIRIKILDFFFWIAGETKCPECSSTYVIEIKDASSPPQQSTVSMEKVDAVLTKTISQTSIGKHQQVSGILVFNLLLFIHLEIHTTKTVGIFACGLCSSIDLK